MSRASRLALVALAVVLLLAPAAALHSVVGHLYAAGLSNLVSELTHPPVMGVSALVVLSVLPAGSFGVVVARATRGFAHLRALTRHSEPACLSEVHYRVFPSDDVVVFTAGLLRPITFVSTGAERALAPVRLRAALLHEEAHQRSQDVMWRLLLRAVGRGFAFVPGTRDAVETATLRTECAADDYAVRSGARRLDLFEAIVAASARPANPLVAGLTDANVEFRLLRLAHPGTPLPGRPTRTFIGLTAAVALPAVTAHVIAVAAAVGSSHLMG